MTEPLTPTPRYHQSRLKIERSKRHFDELNAAIHAFMESRPYGIVEDFDAKIGKYEVRASVKAEIPAPFGPMVGDVVHNLRSALDVLAVELAGENGHTSRTAISETYFPISDSRDGFKAAGLRKIGRLSAPAQKRISELEPYKGGKGELLWKLHHLDILDKHVILVPVGAAIIDGDYGFMVPAGGGDLSVGLTMALGDATYPLKDGAILVTFTDIEPGANPHVEVSFTVAFGEGRIVDGESVIPTLRQFGQIVEEIVGAFEADIR
ncbi:hypothetical protein [Sphingomonas profundi]|uniref:hypothetical protein n=1 Tax=Alterirhizorhabdus profundi TaxID=2681549 RepID=UPI0012E752E8|nr:hypothetical protein [Sphingomonas profundi]